MKNIPLLMGAAFIGTFPTLHAQSVVSSFGTGSSGTTLSSDGNSSVLYGAFYDTSSMAATTDPAYGGTIVATAVFHENSDKDADVTIYGAPLSVRIASGGGDDYHGTSDWSTTLIFNFSNIGSGSPGGTNGYLPSDTWFSVIDLDGNTLVAGADASHISVVAYDTSGNLINTNWLTNFTNFDTGSDPTSPGQPSPLNPTDYATVSSAGGIYSYTGKNYATATPVIAAQTSQNIQSIAITYFGNKLENTQFSFSNTLVPEPGTVVLSCVSVLAFGLVRRRS